MVIAWPNLGKTASNVGKYIGIYIVVHYLTTEWPILQTITLNIMASKNKLVLYHTECCLQPEH